MAGTSDESCIFCKLVAGTAPCYKVYEDEQALAFLDINPIAHWHTLVVPKRLVVVVVMVVVGICHHCKY